MIGRVVYILCHEHAKVDHDVKRRKITPIQVRNDEVHPVHQNDVSRNRKFLLSESF